MVMALVGKNFTLIRMFHLPPSLPEWSAHQCTDTGIQPAALPCPVSTISTRSTSFSLPQHLYCLMETRKEGWHSSRISTFVEMCNCEKTMKNHTQMYRSRVYYSYVHKRQYYCNEEPHYACPLPADAQPFKHVTQPTHLTTIIQVTSPVPTPLLPPPIFLPKTLHLFCEAITKQKPSSHSTFAEMCVCVCVCVYIYIYIYIYIHTRGLLRK